MRILSLTTVFIIALVLCGCSNKQEICSPIIKTEYVEVKIPVTYKLKRPSRPKLDESQPIPIYIKELTSYTETLEIIIDGTAKK